MNAALLLVALSAVGVDHGWQPLPDGGVEYILQIEPEIFESLRTQNDIESYLPPGLDVKKIRVTVGNARLPRDSGPASDVLSGTSTRDDQPAAAAGDDSAEEPAAFNAGADLRSAAELDGAEQPFARQFDGSGDSSDGNLDNASGDAESRRDLDGRSTKSSAAPIPADEQSARNDAQERETNKPSLGGSESTERQALSKAKAADAEKPWLPLTITALALCVSLGANFYLAWIARDARHRYRDLLDQVQAPTAAAA